MPARAALAPDPGLPASGMEKLAQACGAAIVLPEHCDQPIRLAGELVDNGAEIRFVHHDIVEPHLLADGHRVASLNRDLFPSVPQ